MIGGRVALSGFTVALCGSVLGLLTSHAARGFFFGISPLDPLTHTVMFVTFAGATIAATWIPGRRALRIDPNQALRAE